MAQTTPPSMTPAPSPAPQRNDRATFSGRVDAFVTWLTNAIAEFSALATNVYNNAVDAYNSSTAAATQASNAQTQANAAAASAAAAVVTASASAWVNGGTYALNANAISQIDFLAYRKQTSSSVTTIDPKNDSANWVPLVSSYTVKRSARTSNTILGAADKGSLIDITSGTFTQTFTAAATLGDGWFCYIKNSGTGDITLDPNSAELIDGLTSFVMYPNESRLVQCTGTTLTTIVLSPFQKTFTASGSFVKPTGYALFGYEAWGGGASGGRWDCSGSFTSVNGGSGGGYSTGQLRHSQLAATETVTIGAGGASQSSGNSQNGTAGGNTTLGSLVTARGATATTGGMGLGLALTGASVGLYHLVAQGYGANPAINVNNACYGGLSASATGVFAATTLYGGACGGSRDSIGATLPVGISIFGGAGGASSLDGNGVAGVAPGGGGGAVQYTGGTPSSGAGARGELRIWGVV